MSKRKSQYKFEVIHNYDHASEHQPIELNKKTFSVHDLKSIKAKTEPQVQFFDAYYQRQVPIICQIGSAGTGKTAIALYAALSEVLDNSTYYDKIVIIRSAVQARDIGFLKGTEEEKNEAYEAPYVALCDELLKYKTNNYTNLKEKNLIEFENTSFLRGQTFNNTIVIADEIQSMSYHELSTICTRLGYNSRLILCGDMKQNDLHKKGDVSGLPRFLRVLERMSCVSAQQIEYRPEHIVRSGIVKEFLIAEDLIS